jgi:murein DD-endopeptidase MepM/ murein hydrolase activator NlpD
MAQNSPARRVPSHGTHRLGTTYAIDFIPADGTVVLAHDGEPDHEARRSQPALLSYALSQASRVRAGAAAIAGNHVVIALAPGGPYVLLAHLRAGSVRVRVGDAARVGAEVGACGNSGNSTQPHVHVQVTDSVDWATTHGLPMAFRRPGTARRADAAGWMPDESEIVDAG